LIQIQVRPEDECAQSPKADVISVQGAERAHAVFRNRFRRSGTVHQLDLLMRRRHGPKRLAAQPAWAGTLAWVSNIFQPSCCAVTFPVCQRHNCTTSWRAPATMARLRERLWALGFNNTVTVRRTPCVRRRG